MAITQRDNQIEVFVNYKTNLEEQTKKDLKQLEKAEKLLHQNNKWIAERVNSGKKLTKVQQQAIANREKQNKLLVTHINQLSKQHQKSKDLLKIEQMSTKELQKQAKIMSQEARKQEARDSKAQRRQKAQRSFLGAFDPEFATSFSHKAGTTLQYVAAGAGIFTLAQAFQQLGENVVKTDLQMRTMAAVLDLSLPKARILSEEVHALGEAYGGTLESIDQVALSLGRAGIAQQDIVQSTEIVLKMARLTGDTFEQSADAIISFQQVFGQTDSIATLGDKLAYIANVSRLSTQDIGTFSNYALAAAKNVGLTVDAVGGLSAAFSNAGVNASTIGTQIRRFTSLLSDNAESVNNFFEGLGVNQGKFAQRLQLSTAESNQALIDFVSRLQEVDDVTFANLLGGMDILASNSLSLMRNNASNVKKFVKDLEGGVQGQLEATKVIIESYSVTLESTWNKILVATEKGTNSFIRMVDDAAGAWIRAIKQITGTYAETNKLADSLRSTQQYIAELERDLGKDNKDSVEIYRKIIELKQKELSIQKQLTPTQIPGRGDTQARLERRINFLGMEASKAKEGTTVYKYIQDELKKLGDEYEKLVGKAEKYQSLVALKGAGAEDIATNIRAQYGAGINVSQENIKLFEDAIEMETKAIKKARDKQLDELSEYSRQRASKLKENDLIALQGFAINLRSEAEGATGDKRNKLNQDLDVLNKIIELSTRRLEIDNQHLGVMTARQAFLDKEERKKQQVLKAQYKLQEATLTYNNFSKKNIDILREELNVLKDRESKENNQVELLNIQTDIKKKQLQLRKAEVQEAINLYNTEEKMISLRNKDYRGTGISRQDSISVMEERIKNTKKLLQNPDLTDAQREQYMYKLTEQTKELEEAQRRLNDAWRAGATDALQSIQIEANDVYSQIRGFTSRTFDTMTDTFTEFVMTGKASFKDMTKSILADLLKIIIRAQIVNAVTSMFGITPAAAGGGGFSFGMYANGGAFSNGVQKFASGGAFTNSVVSNPTMFSANGKPAVMGEAGPEAIVPLARLGGGSLGVKSVPSNVIINVENTTDTPVGMEVLNEMTRTNEKGEEEKIINVVLKRLHTDSGFRSAIAGVK